MSVCLIAHVVLAMHKKNYPASNQKFLSTDWCWDWAKSVEEHAVQYNLRPPRTSKVKKKKKKFGICSLIIKINCYTDKNFHLYVMGGLATLAHYWNFILWSGFVVWQLFKKKIFRDSIKFAYYWLISNPKRSRHVHPPAFLSACPSRSTHLRKDRDILFGHAI